MANLAVQSSSSSFIYKWTYDVFLSFRGEDTRFDFTGNLYNSLRQRGIRTFIDDEGLKRGKEITPALFKAIEDSRIAIIVFSKNYASSSFCLDELVKILKLSKEEGRLVWPVFYCVDPSEVRHQRGSYGEALCMHQRKFKNDIEKVQKWNLALREAANLSGWHFKPGLEYEYQFIGRIVEEVATRITRSPLHVANYPVGLESRVSKINLLLGVGSDDEVNMLGIYGIGGIGKTTTARAVYNSIAGQFEGLCFLADVREKSITHGLVHLQETLLSNLVREKDIKLGDVNRGIMILKHKLQEKKVLIILDDVDNVEQLQAMAGGCDWFGSGSKIIITTRDKHLLDTHGVEKKYEVKGLNYHDSRDLFYWNAFKRNEVDQSYLEIINEITAYAQGLPLALEVIGSNLYGKSINEWESALDKYKRIPIRRVWEVLKVTYDGLEEEEQEIFLDIASFFKGHKLEYVMEMVQHARGFHPCYGIGVLKDKSLVKIEDGSVILHDLMQDMGREIIRQQSPREPGKRSRLWSYEDIAHVLEENTGTDRVEVIILELPNYDVRSMQLCGKAFKKMKSLKILIIKNVTFSSGPKHLPNSLRVLEWWGYPSPYLPANFHPRKLFILRLEKSCFSFLKPLKGFENLTIMNFDGCECITQIPDVSYLPNLTEMSFNGCNNLVEIHDSVGFLDKLRIMELRYCRKLKSFPPINLTSLAKLSLCYCSSLQNFPEVLGEITNVRELYLWETNVELPSSIQNLTGVRQLEMVDCKRIQLPINIAMMPKLTSIYIKDCGDFQLSKQDQGKEKGSSLTCPKVEWLALTKCNISDESLSICLPWFSNVKILELWQSSFTVLPACIKEFHFLRKLDLNDCKFLREIRGVPPYILNLSAKNCTLLSSQSTSMLLSQELHDTGGKAFSLPGGWIPEWFHHYNKGGSISFWFRNRFPSIALCFVIGSRDELPFNMKLDLYMIINGNREFFVCGLGFGSPIVADHIFVFDLQPIKSEMILKSCVRNEWNRVEFQFTKRQFNFYKDNPFQGGAKGSGVYVFKQKNSMEDIRFTNPFMDNEDNEIPSPTPSETMVSGLDFIKSSGSDPDSCADLQQTQDSTTINQQTFGRCDGVNKVKPKETEESNKRKQMEESGWSPSELLPLRKVRREKD